MFATASDLAVLLGRQLTDQEEVQANLALELVAAEIRAETGQEFTRATSTVRLAGTWSQDLELPQRPVVSVASVALNGVPLAAGDWTWNERALLRRAAGFRLDELQAGGDDLAVISAQGATGHRHAHWGGPASTVEVTYEHGYLLGEMPGDLRALAVRAALRFVTNPTGVRQEALAAYSVTYAEVGTGLGNSLLSDGERRALRRRYGRTAGTVGPRAS